MLLQLWEKLVVICNLNCTNELSVGIHPVSWFQWILGVLNPTQYLLLLQDIMILALHPYTQDLPLVSLVFWYWYNLIHGTGLQTGGLSNRQKEHKKAMPLAAKRAKVARSRQAKKKQDRRSGKQFRGKKAWKWAALFWLYGITNFASELLYSLRFQAFSAWMKSVLFALSLFSHL